MQRHMISIMYMDDVNAVVVIPIVARVIGRCDDAMGGIPSASTTWKGRQMHHNDVIWAPWSLKPPATWLSIHPSISWFTSHFPHEESDGSWLHTAYVSKRSGLMGRHPSVARLFLSPRTVSSQIFLGRPGPLVRGTLMDLHLLIQPLLCLTC